MSFFILQNTQSGKLCASANEISTWFTDRKVVPFFITSNDRTLADQSADGLANYCGKKVHVMTLSSHSSTSVSDIKASIHSYLADRAKVPVIVALANAQQNERVIELMRFIHSVSARYPSYNLKYGILFDEADMTYPTLREQYASQSDLFLQDNTYLHRLGFVTATEGNLLTHSFPECCDAVLQPVHHPSAMVQNYRAMHTDEASIRIVEQVGNHNTYALQVIQDNLSHFTSRMANGQFRKIIINSNSTTEDMDQLAEELSSLSFHVMVFNMNGLKITTSPNRETVCVLTKRRPFNRVLFNAYNDLHLHTAPLVIIGRRKVDRGLTFHYAPRDGSAGLIWSDLILGQIDDVSSAVQKAGRLAGVIAHCPQYSGESTYWTTSATSELVITKNELNDFANTLPSMSVFDALEMAKEDTEARASNSPCATVPIRYSISSNKVQALKSATLPVIERKSCMLARELESYSEVSAVFCSEKQLRSIKKAYRRQTPYAIHVPAMLKKKNCYQVMVDTENKYMYIIKWMGKPIDIIDLETDDELDGHPTCSKCDNPCVINETMCFTHLFMSSPICKHPVIDVVPIVPNKKQPRRLEPEILEEEEVLEPIILEEEEELPMIKHLEPIILEDE
jgi:hypothetical protein